MQSGYGLLELVQRGLFDYFYDHNRLVLEGSFQPPRPMSVDGKVESDSGEHSDSTSFAEATEGSVPETIDDGTLKRRGSTRSARIQKARKGRRHSLKTQASFMAEGLGF